MTQKFRAWHKPTQLMGDVVLIDFYNEKIGILYADPFVQGESIQKYNFNEMELMQSTGLKDKNGVEIFEGDIVEYIDGEYSFVGVVKNSIFGLYARDDKDNYNFEDFADENTMTTEVKIIGNIYENKELLEAGE